MGDDMIRQVIYHSTATRPFEARELAEMLERFRENNERDGLTGLLIYHDGCFVQAIEGPKDAIRETMNRIQTDPRHTGVLVQVDYRVPEREFPDWSMGFVADEAFPVDSVPGFIDFFHPQGGAAPEQNEKLAIGLMHAMRDQLLRRSGRA